MKNNKRITSKDVAELAQVSQSTVSMILNNKHDVSFSEDTIQKVMQAAKKLNYSTPTSRKSTNEHNGLILVFTPTMSNPYYPLLTQSIEQNAANHDYNILLCNTYRNRDIEQYYLNVLTEQLVDGVIYEFTPSFPELVTKVSSNLPVVIVGEKDNTLHVDTIGLSSYKSGQIIAEHLINLGHKKIAFVTTPLTNMSFSRKKRLEGIKDKLKEYNLDKNLIIKASEKEEESLSTIYEIEVGYNMTLELLAKESVTAIIGVNDMTACGVIKALQDKNLKIPEDISVSGFDNIFVSAILKPGLTTINHGIEHRGKLAIDVIRDKIENKNGNNHSSLKLANDNNIYRIEYEPQLVLRQSTGKPKIY